MQTVKDNTAVNLFYRKPKAEYKSIESIFDSIFNYLTFNNPSLQFHKFFCPYTKVSIFSYFANLRFAYLHKGSVNHITGDVHYLAFALPRRNTILTIHDCVLLSRNSKRGLRYWLFYWLWYKLPAWRARVITTISEKSKQELVDVVGIDPDKIRVIPNCYDSIFSASAAESLNRSCHPAPVLLQIGTASHKNLPRVFEALQGFPCTLHIVGRLQPYQKALLETFKIDYTCVSNLSQAELKSLYLQADAVIFTSTYEGFGMPIIEAQALCRPVVTSNLSPMAEVAGGAACLVDPYDVQSIRAGIVRVCQDERYRADLIAQGKKNSGKYTVESVASQYYAVYMSLLNK